MPELSLWEKPKAPPGVLPSFDAYMQSLPAPYRDIIERWRVAEYKLQVCPQPPAHCTAAPAPPPTRRLERQGR